VNKPINLYYFYLCIHIFYFFYIFYFSVFYFLFFLFFWAGSNSAHMGWAGPSQPGPATGPSQWPGWAKSDARVKQFHACMNCAKVIKLPSHSSCNQNQFEQFQRIQRGEERAYLLLQMAATLWCLSPA